MKSEPANYTWSFGSFVCLRSFPPILLRDWRHVTESEATGATDLKSLVTPPAACRNETPPVTAVLSSGLQVDRPAA